ncbi:MAG TPA: cation:proton antiporter [Gemmatimonadales bacterium]|nr:cation:proton antiporter [Gemmatimonadales bacterium]
MPRDLTYILLLFVLFVVPRFLQRYRLPSAITSLLLGGGATALGLFVHDPTIALLATFGIVALFLLAGLDADVEELRPDLPVLLQHLGIWSLALVAVAAGAAAVFGLTPRSAILVGLAILTPSAGFILDSLGSLGLTPAEQRWTTSMAISSELFALGVMFVVLQSTSVQHMALSTLALAGLLAVLPPLFRWFATRVAPFAPKSEFAFLLMVAMVCASATRALGVYYLVGAFLVGLAARQFRTRLPAASSERVLAGVEAFAAVFVPFYFFKAGQGVRRDELSGLALLTGVVLVVGGVALRLGKSALHRRIALGEPPAKSLRIGLALLPTLVFTLVLADLLRERPEVPSQLVGGLVLYTLCVTLVPALVLRVPPADYEAPRLDPLPAGKAPFAAPAPAAGPGQAVPTRIHP